jgi:hypothetical protein
MIGSPDLARCRLHRWDVGLGRVEWVRARHSLCQTSRDRDSGRSCLSGDMCRGSVKSSIIVFNFGQALLQPTL